MPEGTLLSRAAPRLQFVFIRTILVSSLVAEIISVQYAIKPGGGHPWIYAIPYNALVLTHHLGRLFPVRWNALISMIDTSLIAAEAACNLLVQVFFVSWDPESIILYSVMTWALFGSLNCLLILRLYMQYYYLRHRRANFTPFDVFSYKPQSKRSAYAMVTMLFGRSLWSENWVGETIAIRCFRGFMSILFLSAVIIFLVLNIIIKPIQENALLPVREYRTRITPVDLSKHIPNPVRTIVFTLPSNTGVLENDSQSLFPISPETFFSAVNVTPIWPHYVNESETSNCTVSTSQWNAIVTPPVSAYTYQCIPSFNSTLWTLPDLVISVDFAPLAPALNSIMLGSDGVPQINLPVVIGLINDTDLLLTQQTTPRGLLPGTNLMMSYTLALREVYRNSAFSALGIFQNSEVFFSAQPIDTIPDTSISPLISRGANISTLRVWTPLVLGYIQTVLTQDYRDASVVTGFSAVGGLWTTLGGIFTLVFGASMLHILYGVKPLSVFGIAHSAFQSKKMKEACLARYPNIIAEKNNPAERGLLALLREHTIDLSFLEEEDIDHHRRERGERRAHNVENRRDNFVIEEIKRAEEHVESHPSNSQTREVQHTVP